MSLEKLKEDYYSVKEYLSNSDIKALLKDPASFKKESEQTVQMLKGSYFHAKLIEPEKLDDIVIVDASTRTTNKYKEIGKLALLKSEADELDMMVSAVKKNMELYDMIYEDILGYEVPAIANIMGHTWKGKADIVKGDVVYDLKTTSDLDKFKWSARDYNYDSQAYIYNQLFGKEVVFIVVEHGSCRTAVVDCSEEFLDMGKQKVIRALENYNKFFVEKEDLSQYSQKFTL